MRQVPGIVTGIVPPNVGAELRLLAGAGVALVMAALLVAPFVGEIAAAVTGPAPEAGHAERLEERISKTDLSAAVSAKTSSPTLRAPSESHR